MAVVTVPERYGESVLSYNWSGERERLLAMAAVADRTTIRVLQDIGLDPGWTAWRSDLLGPKERVYLSYDKGMTATIRRRRSP